MFTRRIRTKQKAMSAILQKQLLAKSLYIYSTEEHTFVKGKDFGRRKWMKQLVFIGQGNGNKWQEHTQKSHTKRESKIIILYLMFYYFPIRI